MQAATHDHATECTTPRTSNIHDLHLDAVFQQLYIDSLLEKLDRPDHNLDRTQSKPGPTPQSYSLMLPPPSPHRGRTEERASLAHRQGAPSPPPCPPPCPPSGPHPRSLSLPDFPVHPNPFYSKNNLLTPPQQRKSVRLIDLIDEEFVVNSGALGGGKTGGSHCRGGRPRHRRRTSILDMMDRIDQLDSDGHHNNTNTNTNKTKDHYGTNGNGDVCSSSGNDTISTKSSFSSSASSSSSTSTSSSSSFMTSRSYPRGVYIVPVPLSPSSQRPSTTSSSMTEYPEYEEGHIAPLSGPVALVSSEALRHWYE